MIARLHLDVRRPAAIVGCLAIHRDPSDESAPIDTRRPGYWAVSHVASRTPLAVMLDLHVAADLAWTVAKFWPELDARLLLPAEQEARRLLDAVIGEAGAGTAEVHRLRSLDHGRVLVERLRQARLGTRDRMRAIARRRRRAAIARAA